MILRNSLFFGWDFSRSFFSRRFSNNSCSHHGPVWPQPSATTAKATTRRSESWAMKKFTKIQRGDGICPKKRPSLKPWTKMATKKECKIWIEIWHVICSFLDLWGSHRVRTVTPLCSNCSSWFEGFNFNYGIVRYHATFQSADNWCRNKPLQAFWYCRMMLRPRLVVVLFNFSLLQWPPHCYSATLNVPKVTLAELYCQTRFRLWRSSSSFSCFLPAVLRKRAASRPESCAFKSFGSQASPGHYAGRIFEVHRGTSWDPLTDLPTSSIHLLHAFFHFRHLALKPCLQTSLCGILRNTATEMKTFSPNGRKSSTLNNGHIIYHHHALTIPKRHKNLAHSLPWPISIHFPHLLDLFHSLLLARNLLPYLCHPCGSHPQSSGKLCQAYKGTKGNQGGLWRPWST